MAGYAKVAFVGEHFGNSIVNVFHYRSNEWLPNQGNPFDDSLAFLDAVIAKLKAPYLDLHENNFTLIRAEAIGYNDAYGIVTSSPLIRTINETGAGGSQECSGSFISANVGLRCGEQHQINNIGVSKRNRGYLSIGPVPEAYVDNYAHLHPIFTAALSTFAQAVDDVITVVLPAVQLTPIRIHEKYAKIAGLNILQWRTYSDVLGYTLPRLASVRRSRISEA